MLSWIGLILCSTVSHLVYQHTLSGDIELRVYFSLKINLYLDSRYNIYN